MMDTINLKKDILLKSKLRLIDILPILASLLTGFFMSSVANYSQLLSNIFFSASLFTSLFLVIISLFGVYAFYEYKYEKIRLNKLFLFLFVYLIVVDLIVTLLQPSDFSCGGIDIVISNEVKWFSIFEFTALLLTIYYCVFILPQKFPSLSIVTVTCSIYVLVMIVACVYSYIAEHEMYQIFFENISKLDSDLMPEIHSFLGHHNIYAMYLLGAFFALMYLASQKKSPLFYLLMIFVVINILFTSSLGGILTLVLMIVFYFISMLVVNFQKHKKGVLVTLIIFGCLLFTFVTMSIISLASGGKTLKPLYDLFQLVFNGRTSISRMKVWNNSVSLINQKGGWVFGRGDVTFRAMLLPMTALDNDPVFSTHNSYLQLIGTGGIPYLVIFLALVAYGFVLGIKNYIHNKEVVLVSLISAFSFLIYMIIESNEIAVLIILFPVYFVNAQYSKEKVHYDLKRVDGQKDSLIQTISLVITLVSIFLSGLAYPLIKTSGIELIYVPFTILACSVVFQLLLSCILSKDIKAFFNLAYRNIVVSVVFMTMVPLFMLIFNETNIGKGLLIGLCFSLFCVLLYLIIPNLKTNSGFRIHLLNLDSMINRLLIFYDESLNGVANNKNAQN